MKRTMSIEFTFSVFRWLGALALGIVSFDVSAVYLNPNGVGQALIYPYYTVRSAGGNAFNTYLSVTNTSLMTTVAKVRFREGRNSRLVAEMNLYLAPNDVWTAAIVPDADGARLFTADKSCTNPAVPPTGLAFSNSSYADGDDNAGTSLDRTKEGYFEVIEMATLSPQIAPSVNPAGGNLNCSVVQGASPDLGALGAPSGGLTGTATLINVTSGLDASYIPETLAALTSKPFYSPPGQSGTDFDSPEVDPASHATIGNVAYRLVWPRGIDAVNAVLASEDFENEFVLDAQTNSKTDWVLTFPTRRFFVTTTQAAAPFVAPFGPSANGVNCEGVAAELFDRDAGGPPGADFPEHPPSVTRFCWSSGAFSVRRYSDAPAPIGQSDVLGSSNTLGWPASFLSSPSGPGGLIAPPGAMNGRISMRFDGLGFMQALPSSSLVYLQSGNSCGTPVAVLGYPAVGFMIRTFENGTLSCAGALCQGNYASAFPHRRVTRYVITNVSPNGCWPSA